MSEGRQYKRAELAKLLGVSNAHISMAVKRGKLILNDEKKIDDSEPVNADWITAQMESKLGKFPEMQEKFEKADVSNKSKGAIRSKHELELEQKKLDIEKRKEEIKKLRIQREKLEAKVIPADLVRDIFRRNGKAITSAFSQELEKYLTILSDKVDISSKQLAEMREQIVTSTNKAISEGVEQSIVEVKDLVDEYSETRGKGERK